VTQDELRIDICPVCHSHRVGLHLEIHTIGVSDTSRWECRYTFQCGAVVYQVRTGANFSRRSKRVLREYCPRAQEAALNLRKIALCSDLRCRLEAITGKDLDAVGRLFGVRRGEGVADGAYLARVVNYLWDNSTTRCDDDKAKLR
jgi:hypothetical protein